MQRKTTLGLLAAAIILAVISYTSGGMGNVLTGIKSAASVFYRVSPLLVAAFILAGLVQVLVPEEYIGKLLGNKSGLKGYFIAGVAGALIPGGPYVYFPLAASFIGSGAALGPMISFIVGKNLWSLSRIPMEVALLGPQLTLIRFAATLLFPPLAGVIAQTLFGKLYQQIQANAKSRQEGSEG